MIRNYKIKLPADWEVVRLGKVFDIDWGNTNLTKNIYKPEGYPVFSAMGQDGFTDFYEHDGEAIILSAIGARAGKCFFASGKWTAIKNTIVIKVKESRDVDIRFVFYYVNDESYWRRSGSGQPFVTLGMARQQAIPLPPFPEQQKIVYVLDTIQGAIEVQEKLIEKTKELKRAMMTKLFREGTQRKSKFKNQNSKLQFKIQDLSVIADIKYGKAKPQTTGDIPVIGSGGVYAYTEKPLVQKPTIVIGRKGTAGMVHLMLKPCWPSDTTFYLDLDLNLVDPKYLYEFLNTQIISGEEAKTTLPSLKRETLESIGIILPSLDEQREIAEILQTIDQKIEIEQKKKALYEELFRAMLEKLMTAEIRVKDIEFE